ncbi:hypothetical protein B9479_008136 [Cryptococcus floricola]|uniref:Uncharacterized protein n=1 Tax=Cryptococcus floricola TaxID=2591691 RepID=A0A5D3ALP3_9TREE|nr:hypothetical protein B9479_008136 [Cryptococcus floricola]
MSGSSDQSQSYNYSRPMANAENKLLKEQWSDEEDASWDYDDDRHDWDLAMSGTDEAAATATEGHED